MLPVVSGATVQITGDFTAAGGVAVDVGGTLEATQALTITGDVTNNGLVNAGPALQIEGLVTGAGNTTGHVIFAGGYSPGSSAAINTHEDVTFTADNVLTMELGATGPGIEYDQLIVTGVAHLDGTLVIDVIDDYVPRPGDSLALFQWSSVSGEFSEILAPDRLDLDVSSLYTDGTVQVVPEPSSLALGLIGLLVGGLIAWMKRRHDYACPGRSR